MYFDFKPWLGASLLALSVTVTIAAPLEHELLQGRSTPTLPSQDPFYALPNGLNSIKPGTILRYRAPPNPIAAFGILPVNLQASYQILYRTTDSLGNATATVLTILVPHNADLTKVLSYQVAEDASSIDCAPSYAFQLEHAQGPDKGTMVTEAELLLVEAALEQGWVVISPDFLGPNGAFLANKLAGYATLDGIRAALNSASFTGISTAPAITMWGYSGGSVASLWAAELQPSYAPDLKIAGAAVGGTVPNITTVVTSINGKGNAGLIPPGVIGLSNQYPELGQIVDQHLLPQFRNEFYQARSQCYEADNNYYANKDITAMFDDKNLVYTNPVAVRILNENALGKHTPQIPLFIYKSVGDEISPISETDNLVNNYCGAGANIRYQRDIKSNHPQLAIIGAPKALTWLISTMNGQNTQSGCSTKTVYSSLLDLQALKAMSKLLLDALLDLLGKPVGPLFG